MSMEDRRNPDYQQSYLQRKETMPSGLGASFDRAQAAYENRLPEDDDVPQVECPLCEGDGILCMSDCCEEDIVNGMCASCQQPCKPIKCTNCDGSGEVDKEPSEPDYDPWDD